MVHALDLFHLCTHFGWFGAELRASIEAGGRVVQSGAGRDQALARRPGKRAALDKGRALSALIMKISASTASICAESSTYSAWLNGGSAS